MPGDRDYTGDNSVMMDLKELQAAEDELLQHVKEVAQRIAARVRNVLGDQDAEEPNPTVVDAAFD